MLRNEAVTFGQEFQESLGLLRVSHGCTHELDFLLTGFGDLGLDLDRIGRLPEAGTRQQDYRQDSDADDRNAL
jgi:hypothetical protein